MNLDKLHIGQSGPAAKGLDSSVVPSWDLHCEIDSSATLPGGANVLVSPNSSSLLNAVIRLLIISSSFPSAEKSKLHAPTASSPNSAMLGPYLQAEKNLQPQVPSSLSSVEQSASAIPDPYLLRIKNLYSFTRNHLQQSPFRVRGIPSEESFFLHQDAEGGWELQTKKKIARRGFLVGSLSTRITVFKRAQ